MPASGHTWLRRGAATATALVVLAGILGGQSSQAAPRQDLQQVQAQVRDREVRASAAHGDAEKESQEGLGHSVFYTTGQRYSHSHYASKASSAEAILNGLGMGSNPKNDTQKSVISLQTKAFSLLL